MPALLDDLGDREYWFVRYPQAREGEEADHLRLRVRLHGDGEQVISSVTGWAERLRADGLLGRLAFDTYFPELGRYVAMEAAEEVFAADSRLVLAQLTHCPNGAERALVVNGLSLFDVATGFLGTREAAADWLRAQAPHAVADRAAVDEVTRLARGGMQARSPQLGGDRQRTPGPG